MEEMSSSRKAFTLVVVVALLAIAVFMVHRTDNFHSCTGASVTDVVDPTTSIDRDGGEFVFLSQTRWRQPDCHPEWTWTLDPLLYFAPLWELVGLGGPQPALGEPLKLVGKVWAPPKGDKRAIVFIAHGFGEHINRYNELAEHLISQNFVVVGFDHQGHGKSQGERAHVADFHDYVTDLHHLVDLFTKADDQHINSLLRQFGEVLRKQLGEARALERLPRFLIGHSMGGLISLLSATEEPDRWLSGGVVVSGPAIEPAPETKAVRPLAELLGQLIPKSSIPGVRIFPHQLSRDQEEVNAYATDPLNYHGPFRLGWGYQITNSMDHLQLMIEEHRQKELHLPSLLLIHGSDDQICALSGSTGFFDLYPLPDKTLRVFENMKHELYKEFGREEVFAEVVKWINSHLKVKS